jgi:phospholipid transport system substrate-binding protein
MPNVNFQRMTASAVGPAWRQATPSSKNACRKSSRFCWCAPMPGALAQVTDQTISMKPLRMHGRGQGGGGAHRNQGWWRAHSAGLPAGKDARARGRLAIYNLNVLGVWLVETYRSQFATGNQCQGRRRPDCTLAERNKANAKRADVLVLPDELTHAQATACLAHAGAGPGGRADAGAGWMPLRLQHF